MHSEDSRNYLHNPHLSSIIERRCLSRSRFYAEDTAFVSPYFSKPPHLLTFFFAHKATTRQLKNLPTPKKD